MYYIILLDGSDEACILDICNAKEKAEELKSAYSRLLSAIYKYFDESIYYDVIMAYERKERNRI